jgi:hypothetical protein
MEAMMEGMAMMTVVTLLTAMTTLFVIGQEASSPHQKVMSTADLRFASMFFDNLQAVTMYEFNVSHASMNNPGPSRSQTANYAGVTFLKGAAKDLVVNWHSLRVNRGQHITPLQIFEILNDHLRGALPQDMTTVDHCSNHSAITIAKRLNLQLKG